MSRPFLALLCVAALTACSSVDPDTRPRHEAMQMAQVRDGTVVAVRKVKLDGSQTGLGATVGSVAGGVAGGSVGGRRDSVVFATLGAVLGGVLGHAIERGAGQEEALELIVQLRNGERVAIVQRQGDEKFRLGDPVMIISSGRSARVTRALPPVPESAATPASGATSGPRP